MDTGHDQVIAGLDVGSSNVTTVLGRKTPEGVEILGMGECPTEGMRKGAVVNVDATVLAQAPRLAPQLPEMAKRLADVLGIPLDRVSVKAKSPEGLGLLGRKEGMAAMAVVSVEVA